jgi:hypothetical protein
MVIDHTWTEREKHVVYWSGFPLQGVPLVCGSHHVDNLMAWFMV